MSRENRARGGSKGFALLVRLVLAVVLVGAGFVYGYFSHRNGLFPAPTIRRWTEPAREEITDSPAGRWNRVAQDDGSGLPEGLQEELEQLRSIGYLSGSDLAPDFTGVVLNDHELASEGLNLYTSGHAPEAVLMDMDGEVMHTWSYPFQEVWPPGSEATRREGYFEVDYWRRAHLLPNGDLLAIYEGFGIVKIDAASNLIWSYPRNDAEADAGDPGAHHDLFVDDSGSVYVLTRVARVVPRINPGWPILEDFITILSPEGEAVDNLSLLEAFESSVFAPLLLKAASRGDIFHTNTIEVFDGRHAARAPIFKKGNVLISLRELDVIAIVDMDLRQVVWAITGIGSRQHQPTLLDNGNMLLFDNLGNAGRSRVIEFDPLSQALVWEYPGRGSAGLYSATCGSNQRLPGGNTLITETDRGRALEVDVEGNIVWEFLNPHRAGDSGELIASLFEVVRLPPDFPLDWLP
jgi:hypothetical protein